MSLGNEPSFQEITQRVTTFTQFFSWQKRSHHAHARAREAQVVGHLAIAAGAAGRWNSGDGDGWAWFMVSPVVVILGYSNLEMDQHHILGRETWRGDQLWIFQWGSVAGWSAGTSVGKPMVSLGWFVHPFMASWFVVSSGITNPLELQIFAKKSPVRSPHGRWVGGSYRQTLIRTFQVIQAIVGCYFPIGWPPAARPAEYILASIYLIGLLNVTNLIGFIIMVSSGYQPRLLCILYHITGPSSRSPRPFLNRGAMIHSS